MYFNVIKPDTMLMLQKNISYYYIIIGEISQHCITGVHRRVFFPDVVIEIQ